MAGLRFRSKVIGVTLTLFMLATLGVALKVQPLKIVQASSVIIVPDDYPTIQDAVGNATAGDTVYVRAGTYSGWIWINKSLTLVGESSKNTTVALSGGPSISIGLWITASNVTVRGFHFIDSGLVCMVGVDGRSSITTGVVIMNNIIETKLGNDPLVVIGSEDDKIIGNTILSARALSWEGGSTISLEGADNCLVAENNVVAGWTGLIIVGNNNIIAFNNVTNQTDNSGDHCGGITLEGPSTANNTVVGNTLVDNEYGVSCWHSTQDNVIYHNNFIDNVHQAYSQSPLNNWDDGYPSGGNYWSDYNGTDQFSGPYQNVTGSDGIGDTPMVVMPLPKSIYDTWSSIEFADVYPLINPVGAIVGDVNLDGKVDIKDIAVVAHCFGLTAGCIGWNPLADVNGDGRIDIADIALVARNFGKSWL